MNKDFLVLLLQKDIQELGLLTEGFEKLTEFPQPLLTLARQKAENILRSLDELGLSATEELGEIDYQSFDSAENSATEIATEEEISDKNNFDAPLDSEEEFKPNVVEFVPENTFEITNDEQPEVSTETESYEEREHQLDSNLIIDDSDTEEDDFSNAVEVPEESAHEEMMNSEEETVQSVEEKTDTEPESAPEKLDKSVIIINEKNSMIDDSLANSIANQKVDDIRQAINIGDRFRFQRELFNGNGEVMNKTIAYLNQLAKFEEAESFLKAKFGWAEDNTHAEDFLQIVRRRY